VRADGQERICNMQYMEREGLLPDYLNNLNAIIGAVREIILGNSDLERAFVKNLNAILERRADDEAGPAICEYEMAQITAAPDEFCEAFLKALAKWI